VLLSTKDATPIEYRITGPDVVGETGAEVEGGNEVLDERKEEHKDSGAFVLEEDEVDEDGGGTVACGVAEGGELGILCSGQSMVINSSRSDIGGPATESASYVIQKL